MRELSDEEADALFGKAVTLCQKWDAENRLMSGFTLYLDENNTIEICPVELQGQNLPDVHNLQDLASHILAHHQRVRYVLGERFGETASIWNNSPIAQMMQLVEEYLRKESNRLNDVVKGIPANYNIYTLVFLLNEIKKLDTLAQSKAFKNAWKWRQKGMLNSHAEQFFRLNNSRAILQSMSILAQLILCFAKQRELVTGETVQSLIRTTMRSGVWEHIEKYFTRSAR